MEEKKLFGARKVFFRLAGLLVVGKNFSGPKKCFFPIRCLRAPNLQYSLCCPFRFPHSCAQRQPPPKRLCSFAAAVLCKATLPQGVHQLQMCLAIGRRRDQHKPKLSTLRRARQTHQGDFRLTLVSQNQNAKPCSEIPLALAYERMMSFQVS